MDEGTQRVLVVSIIFLIIIIFLIKRIIYLHKYSRFLENEYYTFINILDKCSNEKRETFIKKAQKTSLYKKIKFSNADMVERFKMKYHDE